MNWHNFEYLMVLSLVIFFPLIFSFHKKSYTKGKIKSIISAILTVAPIWIVYDIWATARGHWSFNSSFFLGFKFINLPIEEVLFFVVVPYSCLFVWVIVRDFTTFTDFINRLKSQK